MMGGGGNSGGVSTLRSKWDRYQSPLCLLWYSSTTYYTSIWIITVPNYFDAPTVYTKLGVLFFHCCLAMVIYCYYFAWTIDPGAVPEQFRRNKETSQHSQNPLESDTRPFVERSKEGKLRFCTHCNSYKPDRAHHCRKCGRCVLKMDHHCPWTNSCVGFYNYKYLYLLLFWALVGITYVIIANFFDVYDTYLKESKTWTDYFIIFNYICSLFMEFSIGTLVLFHTGIAIKNLTTLEWMEKGRIDLSYSNVYDLGPTDNWVQIFGDNMFLWFFPTRRGVDGDGITFPTKESQPGFRV